MIFFINLFKIFFDFKMRLVRFTHLDSNFIFVFDLLNDVYINWMDCTMLKKKIVPMPDSKIQLFGSIFLLWRCFWLLILILHRSLSLSWRSIPSPITTLLLLRMRGFSKMAENRPHFLRSVAIPVVYPVYIYIVGFAFAL